MTDSALSGLLSRLLQGGGGVGDGGAVEFAHLVRVVAAGAVHHAAVVPHHQIADPPLVRVDELPLGRVLVQVAQEGARFRHRPAVDLAGMRRQEQRAPAAAGMAAHQPLRHRLVARPFLLGPFGKAQQCRANRSGCACRRGPGTSALVSSSSASQAARMSANSVLPPFSGMTRACSSEYLAGVGLNELSECHSMLPRPNSRRRSSRARISFSRPRLEMSAISGASPRCCCRWIPCDVACSSGPKWRLKASCCCVVDLLVVEHQHRKSVHACDDRGDLLGADRVRQVDAVDDAGEIGQTVGLGRADRKGHRGQFPSLCRVPEDSRS